MYVISIKQIIDLSGNTCDKWVYAGIDAGNYGSGYPCWCYSIFSCEKFSSIKEAKKWFEENKSFLFGTYYLKEQFDESTLGIRTIIYKKVVSLQSNID